ncbi:MULTISPECIES: circularly permuted type 2 ATP-grasp protein [unclassified Polaromonas]|uniref:circularly permuted type 2 ATP-grasp protein n=1 Tax=unclassified Polaromonas TaxID=2638319 RepID=UPI000F077E25|nr:MULTISPECIES: circularly permuted type 2 ATP-grasp protein [unclassified Polaromonas]AYQ30537.1 A circularly permuted ATPgrasp family protein [Polaromonas sp. SP1]QGJ19795.1 A circularly permuted ATPgrasp family protein [Polaromonas sp. Pch-P]
MENNTESLFAAQALESPCALASALAPHAAAGHFDELRGRVSEGPAEAAAPAQPVLRAAGSAPEAAAPSAEAPPSADDSLSPEWTRFFNFLGTDGFYDLNHRTANLRRQIRDNGVTYNVYADANGPQRPWALDLFPMMVSASDWAHIEAGIQQRARLLDRVMADIYGPQELLSKGLLPSALVHAHPGYLRGMQGVKPAGGTYLHIAAFDIAHGPDGRWSVVSQRTQAPSGLGYLLENRLTISLLFPEAFREMKVERLAASYKALVDGLKAMSPGDSHEESRVVLLTPGPYNETYFEHAYLARFLGLTLVEGSDLLVRDDKLYLKTLRGLERVHGLLKRLDDEFLDPLELRSDSTLGVPGLLQVIRAGNVLVVNTPGSAFLESSALLGFLPALSRHLLGETLALPSLATWWCGEQAVMQDVLGQLKNSVIKPTYPGSGMESVIGHTLSRRALDEWAGRILRRGEDYTVQAYLPLPQTPTWQGERISPRSAMLRVFAVADGNGSWQVLPGGLARLAGKNENMSSMQHGGSSADVWVLGDASAGKATAARSEQPALASAWATAPLRHRPPVTSRAAENLFWLGRYTERAENSTRLAQITLQCLGGEDQTSQPLLAWVTSMAVGNALVLDTVPPATQARRVFERALIANLADTEQAASVGYNLRALKSAASAVRERLSQEQWHMIVRTEADFFQRCAIFSAASSTSQSQHQTGQSQSQSALTAYPPEYSSVEALRALESASGFLSAMTGAQTDRMTRDDGWRLLSMGRLIERLNTLAGALVRGFETGSVFEEGGFNAMVALFDSTITFHAQYQQRRDIPALLDLLVLDRDNPRSLGWVVQTLRGRLAKLAGSAPGDMPDLAMELPDPGSWALADLCQDSPAREDAEGDEDAGHGSRQYGHLVQLLEQCCDAALDLSDTLSRRYFSHAASGSQSLGA